jgi:ADP-ribose pyrophosphatase
VPSAESPSPEPTEPTERGQEPNSNAGPGPGPDQEPSPIPEAADLPAFRQTGETLIHQGWAISLVQGEFVDPEGRGFTRDIVRHPGAVGVVAITDDDTVVLVRQYRAPVDQWVLELPAGTCDVSGEAAVATAHRELAEEVGYAATSMTLLTRCLITPGFCDEVASIFLATGLTPVPLDPQGIEEGYMRAVEIPLSRFDALVDDGSIVDASAIMGVGLARRRLAAGPAPGR